MKVESRAGGKLRKKNEVFSLVRLNTHADLRLFRRLFFNFCLFCPTK